MTTGKKNQRTKEQRRKLHKDAALQPSSDTKKSKSNKGKKHKQADELFLSETTQCHALAISTTYRDDSLHIAKRSNTYSNSHCSYFFILSHDSTKLLYLKARYRAVFLGIKAHAGKCNAFAAAYIFRNRVFNAKGHFCFIAAIIYM